MKKNGVLLLVLGLTLAGAALGRSPARADAWAAVFTAPWAAAWAALQGLFPTLIWPWLVLAMLTLAIRAARYQRWWQRSLTVLAFILSITAAFQFAWGFHAGRPSGLERFELTASATKRDAEAAVAALANVLQNGRTEPFDLSGAVSASAVQLEGFSGVGRLPNEVAWVPGWLFGPLNLAGVISPWTYEVHVSAGLPAWAQAAVVAHERAHLAGFTSEQDAEWVGAVAGLASDDQDARYAAALWMWVKAPSELRALHDPGPTARHDLNALREALERYEAFDVRWAWRVYDAWLKSRGDRLGTAGYAAGFDALVRAHAAGLW